jgi:tryptophan halogenase
MKSPIKHIAIVGGGSSGWMTAAMLSKRFPNLKITLIESPDVPIIGVGESTLGSINLFLSLLGLKDKDWMAYCNATHKLAIKFRDFYKKGETFYYPFGDKDFKHTSNKHADWFLKKSLQPDTPVTDFYDSFYWAMPLIYNNKICDNTFNQIPFFNFENDVAYHMDATLFGEFLKDRFCIPNGVNHISDHIKHISVSDDGFLEYLELKDGGQFSADLYVDCSGFKSMLLEQAMGVPFDSFSKWLPNNRAWVTHIPYNDKELEMENVTNCTAIENGWVWNIPLYNRIGSGYVFSNMFVSEDDALKEYKQYLDSEMMTYPKKDRSENLQFRLIEIKNGKHAQAWKNNVVGIGLSYAFVEPLESTGLLSVQELILALCEALYNEQISKIHIQHFNFFAEHLMENFKSFVTYHYIPSSRRDTEYWRHMTNNVEMNFKTDLNVEEIASSFTLGHVIDTNQGGVPDIFVGMHMFPMNPLAFDWWKYGISVQEGKQVPTTGYYTQQTQSYWDQKKMQISNLAKTLPSHYQYLKNKIYNGRE